MIPKAGKLFDAILDQLESEGVKEFRRLRDKFSKVWTILWSKYMCLTLKKRWYARFLLVPIFLIFPGFLLRGDCVKLTKLIYAFILEVFNRDPQKPKVKFKPTLGLAILNTALFVQLGTGPYEYDKLFRPLSADINKTRPSTREGRAIKPNYDTYMRQFEKHTDKYYITGAKRWLMARVICLSVAEAERRLNLALGDLNKYFNREPWDKAMGFQKAR